MTFTEFLEARLKEDKQWALAAQDGDGYAGWDNPSTGVVQVAGGGLDGLVLVPRNMAVHIARHDPARVLREVEAKRAILAEYEKEARVIEQGHRTGWTEGGQAVRETVLRLHASVYADHPDYDESWRP